MIPKPLGVAIVSVVTLVWIANFAAQFVVDAYQVDGWVHTIFLSVVGGALAFSRKDPTPPADPPPELPPAGTPSTAIEAPPPPANPASPTPEPPNDPPRAGGGAHRARLFLLPRAAT